MKKITNLFLFAMLVFSSLQATEFKQDHKENIKALSVTEFEVTDINHENPKIKDLKGKDFFVVSVREPGSDGKVYAVDRDGTIWWHATISSGAGGGHETTNGIHKVLLKERFHMSKTHPSEDGVNNMDFEIKFTADGEALHLGNIAAMSHGCIHVGSQDIGPLFDWATVGMPVVVMRGNYKQFLIEEVQKFAKDIETYKESGNHDDDVSVDKDGNVTDKNVTDGNITAIQEVKEENVTVKEENVTVEEK
ncbi:Bll4150 protein [hydrothermal vent metagenome]|uniref:Bll4150 protein n=1 Tax=hydrothermal vent metagenome TaxID=652676 RepID=A0A1W1EFT1_9ZZZZ